MAWLMINAWIENLWLFSIFALCFGAKQPLNLLFKWRFFYSWLVKQFKKSIAPHCAIDVSTYQHQRTVLNVFLSFSYKKTSETLKSAGQATASVFNTIGSSVSSKFSEMKYVFVFLNYWEGFFQKLYNWAVFLIPVFAFESMLLYLGVQLLESWREDFLLVFHPRNVSVTWHK